MKVDRGRLNWGVFFIVLGAVPLAVNARLVDASVVAQLAALWPLVLIALGIGLILRFGPAHVLGGLVVAATLGLVLGSFIAGGVRTPVGLACTTKGSNTTPVTANGTFTAGGRISAELSCVDLVIDGQAGNGWNVAADGDANRQPTIEQSTAGLTLRSEPQRFSGPGPRLSWHVTLPQAVPISIDLTTNASSGNVAPGAAQLGGVSFTLNASDIDFHLRDVTALTSLSGTLNASSSTLVLPSAAMVNGSITLNASSLTLCTAPSANVDIQLSQTLSSNNLAAAGLVRSGDRWVTPNPGPGAPTVAMNMTTNVSSLTLDRTGACQ